MKNAFGYLKNIYRYDTSHVSKTLIIASPNSMPGPLLVGHGLEKLHHDVRIHFELELLLRVAHDLPTVLHDELNGGVAKALQHVLHGKEERVHGVLRLDRLCVWGGVSSYRSSGRSKIDRFCGWFKFLNIKGTWKCGGFSGVFAENWFLIDP